MRRVGGSRFTPVAGAGAALAVLFGTSVAAASNGLESPDNGVLQLGRGSAWVARADDPIAAFYNPAGLVRQSSGVYVGASLMFMDTCFTRLKPDQDGDGKPDPVSPGNDAPGPGAPNGPRAEVCADAPPFPNPNVAASLRVHDRLAIGLALVGPHSVGSISWPEHLPYNDPQFGPQEQPAPNRYMVLENDSLLIYPTVSAAYAVNDDLSIGAGFIWGIASVGFATFSEGISSSAQDEFHRHQDVHARMTTKDLFIPGFLIGALWSPTSRFDLGAWFKWIDDIDADAHLRLTSRYWTQQGRRNESPCDLAAGEPADCNITDPDGPEGRIRVPNPMEAKLGVRYHHPRNPAAMAPGAAGVPSTRDPLRDDLFDVELDLTWAHNSAFERVEMRVRGGEDIPGERVIVRGMEPGTAPTNADVPHHWRDVVGVRLGGDYVVLPNRLAVRAGGFFESKGQDDDYLNLDFHMGTKLGLSGGVTVRVGPLDVSAAYQHTFYGTLDNGGRGKLKALSGDGSTPDYRSRQTINGGRFTASLNEVALGGTLRF